MKIASLLQKGDDPRMMTAQEVLDMVTVDAASALGLKEAGSLEEGKRADLVTVDINESMTPAREERIVSHLVFSNPSVSETIVDGRLLVRSGKLASGYGLE